MKLEVRLFAGARDRVGAEMLSVEIPEGATIAELRRRLALAFPALNALLPHSVFAVDDEFASDSTVLTAGAAIALLPPVSGGQGFQLASGS